MKYFVGILLVLFLVPSNVMGQSLKRQSISSYAASASFEGITVLQTAGQSYFTKAGLEKEFSVLQGFQQPALLHIQKSKSSLEKEVQLNIFPNPANLSFTIQSMETIENPVIQVSDVYGKILFSEKPLQLSTLSIDCEKWQNGLYFIYVKESDTRSTLTKLIIYK